MQQKFFLRKRVNVQFRLEHVSGEKEVQADDEGLISALLEDPISFGPLKDSLGLRLFFAHHIIEDVTVGAEIVDEIADDHNGLVPDVDNYKLDEIGHWPKEGVGAVKHIDSLDENQNAVSACNSPPSHVLDDLTRVLLALDLVISHVLAGEVTIADVAIQKRLSTFFIVFARVFGGWNFLTATKRTIHMLGLELAFLSVLKHLIVTGDVTTFALDHLFIEKNFHVASNRSVDERVGAATGTLHFPFTQVLSTSDAENLVTS